jgi:Fe-S-cluster-containing hydrogenase component 2
MAEIKIDNNKCCECYLCEVACSLQYTKDTVNPKRSRIVVFFRRPDVNTIDCDHCGDDPQCIKACISDALALHPASAR